MASIEGSIKDILKIDTVASLQCCHFCWKSRGSRTMLLLLQFSRYRDAVCGIIRTTKLAKICRKRNFEFLPQIFFRAFQSQNFFFKFFWLWWALKNVWGKNSKICSQRFVGNSVVRRMPQTAFRYLENCRRSSILRDTGTAKTRNGNIDRWNFFEKT